MHICRCIKKSITIHLCDVKLSQIEGNCRTSIPPPHMTLHGQPWVNYLSFNNCDLKIHLFLFFFDIAKVLRCAACGCKLLSNFSSMFRCFVQRVQCVLISADKHFQTFWLNIFANRNILRKLMVVRTRNTVSLLHILLIRYMGEIKIGRGKYWDSQFIGELRKRG